jgi:putative AdoMet-dependent methyltransferase
VKINELAKRLNLTPRAIRLYEKSGLLSPERDPSNGYRLYSEHDAWRLQTIAALRELGMGLNQIKLLLENFDQGDTAKIHHYLELQRMAMFSKWVQWKYAITIIDELVNRFEGQQELFIEDLFQLAQSLRQIQTSHSSWQDRWNFDHMAIDYDKASATIAAGPFGTELEYRASLDFIVQWIAPQLGEMGLDIGTGTGNLAGLFLSKGVHMFGIDQSNEMLTRCRSKFPTLSTKLGNALSVPYLDKQFDFIVSAFAFHHLDDGQQTIALDEMSRVLKPGGRICIAGPMSENILTSLDHASLATLTDKPITIRSKLLIWFHEHDFITVQHQINEWIHVVYAVRKN